MNSCPILFCVGACVCVSVQIWVVNDTTHLCLHTNLFSPFHSSPLVGHGAQWQSHVIAHWERQFLANINRTLADQKGRDRHPEGRSPTLSLSHLRLSVCEWLNVVYIVIAVNATQGLCRKGEWCVTCGMKYSVCLVFRMNPPHFCSNTVDLMSNNTFPYPVVVLWLTNRKCFCLNCAWISDVSFLFLSFSTRSLPCSGWWAVAVWGKELSNRPGSSLSSW